VFRRPESVAVDSAGNVFVADIRANRILEFDPSGALINSWGGRGTGAGEFVRPRGLAVDASDHVFVVDSGNYRIQGAIDSHGYVDASPARAQFRMKRTPTPFGAKPGLARPTSTSMCGSGSRTTSFVVPASR
jgi:DNA-binding beta-propeller fold protein YncE